MKNKKYVMAAIILIVVLIFAFVLASKDPVIVKDIKWSDERGVCSVSFVLHNKSNIKLHSAVNIYIYDQNEGLKYATVDVVGQKGVRSDLFPNQEKNITEAITHTGMGELHSVDVIVVEIKK